MPNTVGGMAVSDPQPRSNSINNFLQSLIDLATPNGANDTQDQANQMNQQANQQQQLHPVAQAALDGAIKATKEQAYEAVQQGGPDVAKHIVDTYAQPQQSDPKDVLTNLLATLSSGQQTQTSNQGNVNAQQQPQQNNNPLSLLHNLVQGVIDIIPTSPEAKLANSTVALNRMKMAAGLPAETALPLAQAGLAKTEAASKQAELTAGGPQANVDLTKQQIAASKQELVQKAQEIKAGIYKTQSERQIQNIQRLTERRKQVLDQMNEDLQHGPITNRGERLKEYKRQLNWYDNQLNNAGSGSPQQVSSNPPPELIAAARKKGIIK